MAYGFQHGRSAVAVLNIGGRDDEAEEHAGGIDDDMGFAAHGLLSGVIAANAACLSGLHRLAVDDARARLGLAPLAFAHSHGQMEPDRLPQPAVAPLVEIALHCRGRREILWQLSPLASR